MTSDTDLPDLAVPYALNAVSDAERADIEHRLAQASTETAEAFQAEVRAVREAMATASSATALAPPAELRRRALLVSSDLDKRRSRRRARLLAGAAALVIGAGAFGAGLALRPVTAPTTAEQVLSAQDVRTASGSVRDGGTATFVYSRDQRSGVLVMNNVAPPPPGMTYQMWLMTDQGPKSAGTVAAVSPSTTAMVHGLGNSNALAFTVEPAGGSEHPTGDILARLSLP